MTTQRGFTLIEMAIVLVIITILIGGLAMPLSAQIQARRIAETKKTLEEAREAILGYAMTHLAATSGKRYLPCPDTSGDGKEDRNLATNACIEQVVGSGLSHGRIPWVDLGVAPQDAWGNRLLYAVNTDYSNKVSGFSSTTTTPPLDDPLWICTTNTCASADVASDVVFVVASLGPNGWGALNVNGTTLAQPSGLDEKENLDADQTYISRTPTKPEAASGEFDDLLTWVSLSQLIAKICPTGSDCNP
ncbi:MAG: prepilin-type N-terminal cleavage/methylation domain-containing protein [Gammaproteobacteria bacterium]|nr:prepilin-type N-terminal cleavage/methylation domain-containing protein [Gammaproteobacteria bacterium]MBU1407527.1 prepilin-type N-terminal cleavage/methylation domain-containing protein [Gammaproteobacteria bacterium]MBU1531640.1 prepilin-type N-terminal cleavage/methylation domain-containing protein [Gammaproteobacteria bacterium]